MQISKFTKTEFTDCQCTHYDSCDNLDVSSEQLSTVGVSHDDSKVQKTDRYSCLFNQRNQRQLGTSLINMNSSILSCDDGTSTPRCSFSDESIVDDKAAFSVYLE